MSSNTEVTIIVCSFVLLYVLLMMKAYFHFQYLKTVHGYFKNADSFITYIINPFGFFKFFPESFIILYFPVLWDLKRNPYRYKTGIYTYLCLITLIFIFVLGSQAGR